MLDSRIIIENLSGPRDEHVQRFHIHDQDYGVSRADRIGVSNPRFVPLSRSVKRGGSQQITLLLGLHALGNDDDPDITRKVTMARIIAAGAGGRIVLIASAAPESPEGSESF
jgi:hypothetical protein